MANVPGKDAGGTLLSAAAQLNIDKLIAAGILHEVTGRKRNRLYVAHEVLRALEEAENEV